MSDVALRADSLSKLYHIGAHVDPHATLRDRLADSALALARLPLSLLRSSALLRPLTSDLQHPPPDTIWALKDVSFEVKQGEVVGIPSAPLRAGIGRNGAGTHAPHCVRCGGR